MKNLCLEFEYNLQHWHFFFVHLVVNNGELNLGVINVGTEQSIESVVAADNFVVILLSSN